MTADVKYVDSVGLPGSAGDLTVARMGFKAYNLARMARLGLPVPQAFVLGTPLCAEHHGAPQEFADRQGGLLKAQMARLQAACGLEFAAERKPLLVSVRSGAPVSMPGMMDTLLNIGLTDATLRLSLIHI